MNKQIIYLTIAVSVLWVALLCYWIDKDQTELTKFEMEYKAIDMSQHKQNYEIPYDYFEDQLRKLAISGGRNERYKTNYKKQSLPFNNKQSAEE